MKKIFFAAALAGAAMLASCGGGNADGVQKGSLSKFDSLSYALGANIGYSLGYQMKDIPFDAQLIRKGVEETALGKSSLSHDDALETLRTYFMTKRGERAQAIAKQRAEADSVRRAGGDTTKVEYPAADPAMFATEEERDSLSYALGNDIGFTIANAGLPLQVVWIGQAIQDVFDNTAKMPEKEVGQYLQHYFMVTMPMQNAKASEEWLSKIEKQSGVKKTESGLLYKVVKEGDASVMAKDPRDVVKVHYTGRTRKGKVFDTTHFSERSKEQQEMLKKQRPDSYDKDEPIEFPLNRVIRGWTEGMQLVGKGGTIKLLDSRRAGLRSHGTGPRHRSQRGAGVRGRAGGCDALCRAGSRRFDRQGRGSRSRKISSPGSGSGMPDRTERPGRRDLPEIRNSSLPHGCGRDESFLGGSVVPGGGSCAAVRSAEQGCVRGPDDDGGGVVGEVMETCRPGLSGYGNGRPGSGRPDSESKIFRSRSVGG